MAEAAAARLTVVQGLKSLEDPTECSIHCGTCENPRQLPCLHSFCLQCLIDYTKDNPLANNITCPLCRKEITVPDNGIEGFPRNSFIDKTIEIKRLTSPLQKDRPTLCDICQEDEELTSDVVPVASMFCAECRKNICDRCTKEHRRQNKSHCVLKIGSEEISEQLVKKLEVSFCNDHSGKALEMFCFDCQSVICITCFAEKHKLHNCSDINNSAKDFLKQMELEIHTISVCLSEVQKTNEAIDKKKDDFLQQMQSVEEKICERSEDLRRIIDRDTNLLLDKLKIIKSSHLKEMQIKEEEIQRQLTIFASLKAYGNKIIAVGSSGDICRSVNPFSARTKEVQATLEEALIFWELVCRSVYFQPTEFEESVDRNVLGRLDVICEKLPVTNISDPEKSLQKKLEVNIGKKESSIDLVETEDKTLRGRSRQLKDLVKVEEYNVPDIVNAGNIISVAQPSAKSKEKNQSVHSLTPGDQSASKRQNKPFLVTSLQNVNSVDHPQKPGERLKITSITSDSLACESKRVKNQLIVRINHANIIKQNTDVLVSYEDEWLQSCSVLAIALKEAAGPAVERELSDISKTQGPLKAGQVVHTSAGKLCPSVKYLVHAIRAERSQYHPEDPKTFEILYQTFLNCFNYTNSQICKNSISIPPIGARKYGVQLVSAAFLQAVAEYDETAETRPSISLHSIHFVDQDPAVVKQIIKSIESLLA